MGKIKYSLVPRKNRETGEIRAYANAVMDVISFDDLTTQAAAETTVTKTDVEAVVRCVIDIMQRELLKGNNVQLGKLGTLYVTLSGKGAKAADEFTTSLIKRVNIRFRPDEKIKKELGKAEFELSPTKKLISEATKTMKEGLQAKIDEAAEAGDDGEGGGD